MKILVTGGSGFIGSNFIIKQILEEKNFIVNLDNLTYASNNDNFVSINPKNKYYSFVNGNICNAKIVNETLKKNLPDIIVHFAAESHVDRSINEPLKFVKTNILGTANLLNCSLNYYNSLDNRAKKLFKFIHISTDEVFGSLGESGLFNEFSPYKPNSPYSASKASSDHLVRSWNRTYNFPTIITNCSNNYGPYQFPEKLIPLIIANCFDKKALPVYGDGLNVRDWLFVEDHCDAIYLILKNGKIGSNYNIGGNNEISNIDLIKTICTIMDKIKPLEGSKKYSNYIQFVKDRPGHDKRYAIDNTKIKKDLNWLPKEDFSSGIEKTIKWYIENEDWWRKIQNNKYNQERLGLIDD